MFGNLKNKIGEVADLKKLSAPQSLVGSRGLSRQHTPGSVTPGSSHSRQPSTASLQALGSPSSPPLSPADQEKFPHSLEREQELEREVVKLRSALESQMDASLQRLNTKEQEWRKKLQDEKDRADGLARQLEEAAKMEEKLEAERSSKQLVTTQLEQAKGLEAKVCEMQDNYDQLEGLNAQEGAKVKHMLLNTNSELDKTREELSQKSEALSRAEARLGWVAGVEDRLRVLTEEKTELETQVAGLNHKLLAANTRYEALEEAKREEVQHLEARISTLEQRHSQTTLQETDKVQALIREREVMEHSMEEARQQLNNIKASWSTKITALEQQIHHLNIKMAEDQTDLKASEERNSSLTREISVLKEGNEALKEEKADTERKLQAEISQVQEDVETLKWQLSQALAQKEEQEKDLKRRLSAEEEKNHSCSGVLQCKIETIAALEMNVDELEAKVKEVEGSLATTREDLARAHGDKKYLQEAVNRVRAEVERADKARAEVAARLEVVTGEKARLSRNLDEYLEKVNSLEGSVAEQEEECRTQRGRVAEMEGRLEEAQNECQELQDQLKTSEADLALKIEESDTVKSLKETVKNLEDELVEKKQSLKIQGQRLADMKKTIQRELRLTADIADTPVPVPAATATAAATTVGPTDTRLEPRPWEGPPANNGPLATTNGNGNYFTVNLAYLKHVIIKFLTSREYEAVHLTRAVATLLLMSPEEERLLRETLEWKMSWFGSKPNLGKGQESLTIPSSQ